MQRLDHPQGADVKLPGLTVVAARLVESPQPVEDASHPVGEQGVLVVDRFRLAVGPERLVKIRIFKHSPLVEQRLPRLKRFGREPGLVLRLERRAVAEVLAKVYKNQRHTGLPARVHHPSQRLLVFLDHVPPPPLVAVVGAVAVGVVEPGFHLGIEPGLIGAAAAPLAADDPPSERPPSSAGSPFPLPS